MLIEFDMLFAVFALMLILPVALFQIISNQNAFTGSFKLIGDKLVSNSNVQKLVYQLDEIDATPDLTHLIGNISSSYSLAPYNRTTNEHAQDGAYSRLVVFGGRMYYLSVKK